MKTLELKDICGYLPYGLRIMRSPTNVPVVAELLDIRKDFTILGAGHIDTYRAVLRPMSDLTKEITHKGEKFVPLVELAKIALRDAIAKRYYNDVDFVIKNDYVKYMAIISSAIHTGSFEMCRTISDFDELTCLHQ